MNIAKIIFVLLFTCLLVQNYSYSSTDCSVKYDSTYLKKLYEKGEKSYQKKDYTAAKKRLIKFISIPCPVKDTTKWNSPGYQYTRMKNKSCEYLKNIFFEENNYSNSLYYFNLFKGIYRLSIPRCGNELYYEEPQNALFMSQCYEGMFKIDSAISVVSQYVGTPSNILYARFVELAIKKIGVDSLKSELLSAIDHVYFVNDYFSIRLLEYNIRISHVTHEVERMGADSTITINGDTLRVVAHTEIIYPDEEQIEEEKIKVKEAFIQSEFYKLIMEK